MKLYYFASLVAFSALHGEMSLDGALDAQKPKYEQIAPSLQNIRIMSHQRDMVLKPPKEPGVQFVDIEIPGGEEGLRRGLEEYIAYGVPLTLENLSQIKQTVIRYYRNQNHPVMMVIAPQQNFSEGLLQLVIVESKLGEVEYSGNKHFPTSLFEKNFRLKKGESIDSTILFSDVNWMNRNPFHHTDIILTPGKESGTTDIRLVTKDRRSFRLFAGGDNTGNSYTGLMRYYAGFNWANVFGADQIFTYQYTASEDFYKFQAHTINYVVPLPWRNIINIYGGYSSVHPDLRPFKNHGKSAQGSFRYTFPAGPTYNQLVQDWTLGFDYKWTNNELIFGSTFIGNASGDAVIGQAMGQYHLAYETAGKRFSNKVGFDAEIFWSPGHVLPHQTTKDYQRLRADAHPNYVFGRVSFEDIYKYRRWQL